MHVDPKPAAADGYIFANASLTSEARTPDGWREGGIALTTDSKAPSGFAPYVGAVQLVDAVGGSVAATATPDAQGLTAFSRVAAGRYKVRVATHDFPITLIGGATVRWGPYPITRPRAYEIAKQLAGSAIRPNLTFIAAPQTPVPAGVVLSPALGDGEGRATAATDHSISKASWLFYIDPFAEMRFDHPVKYVLVDAASGDASAIDENSWPALNGHGYYRETEESTTSADVLLLPAAKSTAAPPLLAHGSGPAPRQLAAPWDAASTIVADHVPDCGRSVVYALLVQGADEGPENADMKNIKTLLPASTITYESRPGGGGRVEDITEKWAKIKAAATPCDTVFLYVTSHGARNGYAKLDTTDVEKDGTPKDFVTWSAASLDWDHCRACHITVILDYCYSGREIDLLKPKLDKPGKKVFVMTSTDGDHQAGSYSWWNLLLPTGGAFTSSVVNAFSAQSGGGATPSMPSVFSAAQSDVNGTLFNSEIRHQDPQFWSRLPKPGETCAVQPSSTIDRPSSPPPTPPQTTPPPTTAPPTVTAPRQTTGAGSSEATSRPAGSVSPLARIAVLNVMIAEGANQNTGSSLTDPVVGRVYQGECPIPPPSNVGHTWRLYIRVEGQNVNKGDQIHLVITGPNMPSELTVTLDDTADTSLDLPGHTEFIGPFPTTGTINISVTADKVNGVPFAFVQTQRRSLNCG